MICSIMFFACLSRMNCQNMSKVWSCQLLNIRTPRHPIILIPYGPPIRLADTFFGPIHMILVCLGFSFFLCTSPIIPVPVPSTASVPDPYKGEHRRGNRLGGRPPPPKKRKNKIKEKRKRDENEAK